MSDCEILSIPLAEIYPDQREAMAERTFVYSPIADFCTVLPSDQAERLCAGDMSACSSRIAERLLRPARTPVREMCVRPEENRSLVFLLNQKCNFSCKYCYSAQGRSSAELDGLKAERILESFLRRWAGGEGAVSFGGGGDPLMSWTLLKHLLQQARKLAEDYDVKLDLVVTTNGSLLTDEIIDVLLACRVRLQISFEILPDIQERQRGHFDVVAANVDRLLERAFVPNISCVITPASVERQCEIVSYCLRRFPGLPHASFDYVKDYVKDLTMCENVERLTVFLERFYVNFHEAKALAAKSGFRLSSPFERKIRSCKSFSCAGNFVVTPNADVTACPRISSPQESAFARMRIGTFTEAGEFVLDQASWDRWRRTTWQESTGCPTCVAKWNCGGGCPLERDLFAPEMRRVICDFTRRFIVRRLISDRGLLERSADV